MSKDISRKFPYLKGFISGIEKRIVRSLLGLYLTIEVLLYLNTHWNSNLPYKVEEVRKNTYPSSQTPPSLSPPLSLSPRLILRY